MDNVRGRELVEGRGMLCNRRNGRLVDPNRNFKVDWGVKEADYSAYEENPGSEPYRCAYGCRTRNDKYR